jgi:nucleoside-diphosphate-sugar epimerase
MVVILKKKLKKKIVLTGGSGLLGSYFHQKYKTKYSIKKYPYKVEDFKKFNTWLSKNKFNYFIHFAAITKGESINLQKKLNLINTKSSINLLESIKKKKNKDFRYFLFISTSHVYGNYRYKIKETKKRNPQSLYGLSKKRVEDFIIQNRKKFNFKIGIARVFNSTGPNQKKGNFVPDMVNKIKKQKIINNVNQYRDFIHIDDVSRSINQMINKEIEEPINVSSGKKINLIKVCKILNDIYFKKKLSFGKKRGKDLFGDNSLLKKIGIKKFKDIYQTISIYKK